MTFRDCFRLQGFRALLGGCRADAARIEQLESELTLVRSELKAEQSGRREDQQVFLDRILAKNQVSTVFEPPLPKMQPIVRDRSPFEVMNDGQAQIDAESAAIQAAYEQQQRQMPQSVKAEAERLRAM